MGDPAALGAPASSASAPLGLLELLDRDGHVRQAFVVRQWPLRIGRALDNDVVLSDAHVAAHHLVIAADDSGLALRVADTRNGVGWGARQLRAGERAALAGAGEPVEFGVGHSRLRLRLPGHQLAAELPLVPSAAFGRGAVPLAAAALLLLAGVLFNTYLNTDPDGLARAAGSALLTGLGGAAVWCGAWALLSKTFTRQAHFGWHLRVFVLGGLALLGIDTLAALGAFALSWPWLTDFAFVGESAVGAAVLYFHLLAVEPARHRVLRWAAAAFALVGIGLTVWFNLQRTDLLGNELYMSHLFPPPLRAARPVSVDAFVDGLAPLRAVLDRKAREPARGDDTGRSDDE